MRILLCAATEFEIQPTLDILSQQKENNVEVLITGIGMMETTYRLTKQLAISRPEMMIQAGIAGALNSDIALGETVIVEKETIGDMGVVESNEFKPVFKMGLTVDSGSLPWKNGWLVNESSMLDRFDLKKVAAISVNEISTSKDRIDYYKSIGGEIESMEGAAFHYCALQENIPFIQLRSISNEIGERDKSKWKMKESIASLNKEIQSIITKLNRP